MECYPLHMFSAGTALRRSSKSHTWEWHSATEGEAYMFRDVCIRCQDVEERRDHQCYRDGLDARLAAGDIQVRNATIDDILISLTGGE